MVKKIIFIQALTLCAFWIIYMCFQHYTIYHPTLGKISDNWQNTEGNRVLANVPYTQPNQINFVQWDAKHYQLIKENGYDTEKAGGDYIYAFFPLFPAIWKASLLPPLGIFFLNYVFFSISILLLLKLFSGNQSYIRDALISLSLPGLIIFMIPYTEATYLLMVTIGIWGFAKNKYWIFFIGFFLAALSRPSFTFLMLSILGVEFFFSLNHKSIATFLRNSVLRTLPLICGTAMVSVIQFAQGSKTVFKFIQVQKYWENILAVPHNIKDWSHEGFGINLGIVLLIFVPLFALVLQLLFAQFKKSATVKSWKYESPADYFLMLSILYLIGNTLFVLLFRGGSLNCLFRFTICSPFVFILLYCGFVRIKEVSLNTRCFIIITLAMISVLMLGLIDYSTFWNFSDFGMFLLIATLMLWTFQDLSSSKLYGIALYLTLFANVIWTTYLFNMYIVDGWIFA